VKVKRLIWAGLLCALATFPRYGIAGGSNVPPALRSKSEVKSHWHAADLSATDLGVWRENLDEVGSIHDWTVAGQIFLLLLSVVFALLALKLYYRARHQTRRREEAENELNRARHAMELRVQERTRELSLEVEERRRAEELNRGQKQVLEMLATQREQKTEDILRVLAETVASQRRSWECSLHLVDPTRKTLQLAASSEDNERLKRYLASISADFPDAPESQACAAGEPCIVEKMTEVRRPWSELLVANGIHSAFSIPFRVAGSGDTAGTLTVYSRLQNGPSPRDLEMLESAAGLGALVIEHRRIHAELLHNAYQDPLTGLPNRRAGEQALESAIDTAGRRCETLAVLWIDLDRFKRVNDQFGHGAGDRVLRMVADRLRANPLLKGSVMRMGGDEFLALIPGRSAATDAGVIAGQLGKAIAEPILVGSAMVTVSASIGVSLYPRDGASLDMLQRNADFAMYRAKTAGGGMCVYSPVMSAETGAALELEQALSVALESNYLRVVYQPIYAQDGHLTGFEALLRFHHPRLGDIPPSRFIPIAEEMRLIVPIGNWVLHQACRQLQSWMEAGLPRTRMGVNISALQFAHEGFAGTVSDILCECAVPPENLLLELTETVVMGDFGAVVRQMNLLKDCGVRIAMDDFGTGYSSLSYIHRLPIDVLKIDRSFIERLDEIESTRPIVEAVISMATRLGLMVIAEGVETERQRRTLQEAGCHGFQGYLFARPLPPEQAGHCLAASVTKRAVSPQRAAACAVTVP
jgi:diguanylate cyclase (GGDEF)-like protein